MNVWNSYGIIPGGENYEGGHFLTFEEDARKAKIKSLQEDYKTTLKHYRKYRQEYPYTLKQAKKKAEQIVNHVLSLPSLKTEKAKYKRCVKALIKAGMTKADAEIYANDVFGRLFWNPDNPANLPQQKEQPKNDDNDDIVFPSTQRKHNDDIVFPPQRSVEPENDLEDFELPQTRKALAEPVVHMLQVRRRGPKTPLRLPSVPKITSVAPLVKVHKKAPSKSQIKTRSQLPIPTLSKEDQATLRKGNKLTAAEIHDLIQRHFINPMNASRPTLRELQKYM